MVGTEKHHHLHPLSFGLALGITWGLSMFVLGLAVILFDGWGEEMLDMMASLYVGYDATFLGSLLGAAWGFVDAFIGGLIIAWIYNCCAKCMCGHHEKKS